MATALALTSTVVPTFPTVNVRLEVTTVLSVKSTFFSVSVVNPVADPLTV